MSTCKSIVVGSESVLRFVLLGCVLTLASTSSATAQSILYIAEFDNALYSRATLSGPPPYPPAGFVTVTGSNPNDLVVDAAGNAYISYRQGVSTFLRKYDSGGAIVPGFGTGGTVNTGFGQGVFMSLDASGNILIVESQSSAPRLTRRDPGTGAVITNFNLVTTSAAGVVEDAAGFVYLSGFQSHQLSRFNADGTGGVLLNVNGGALSTPHGLEFDDVGRLLVMNAGSSQLERYRVSGTNLILDPTFGTGGFAQVPHGFAADVDRDPVTGRLYVSGYQGNTIYSFDTNGLNGADVVTGVSGPYGVFITPVPEPSAALLAAVVGAGAISWVRRGSSV